MGAIADDQTGHIDGQETATADASGNAEYSNSGERREQCRERMTER